MFRINHFRDETSVRPTAIALLFVCLTVPSLAQNHASGSGNPPSRLIGPVPSPPVTFVGPSVDQPPSSLEQRPASAPQVAFHDGQLTIVAQNSTLGAILQDVEVQTGASIDMPSVPTDRVAGQFGPGPAREVLASLLNGSHFNYVLMGTPQNPNALERVVLLNKSSGSDQPVDSSQPTGSTQGMQFRPGAVSQGQDSDDASAQDNTETMQSEDTPAEDQADSNNGPPGGMPAIKTPQQLLQELQRQQQIQQQSQSPPAGPLPQTQERRPPQ